MRDKNKKKAENREILRVYGKHAVYSALSNNKRFHNKLFISETFKSSISKEILNNVKEIKKLKNKDMNNMFGNESNHQGIVLMTSKLKQPKLEEFLLNKKNKEMDLVVILDQITDPQNIGAIMRSCSLFNCKTIIVSDKNSPDITSAMMKIASGAVETTNYIKVINLSRAIKELKKNNYWIYGFDNNDRSSFLEIDLPKKCAFVFGSEGKGMRNLTKKECDEILSITTVKNQKYKIESLNVSNACTIALYEYFKKYKK